MNKALFIISINSIAESYFRLDLSAAMLMLHYLKLQHL